MKVSVRLFASFAQLAGWRERELELPDSAVAGDVLTLLRKGALIALPPGTRPLLAVNRAHVPPTRALVSGDEVAIFPPVSGGAPESADSPSADSPGADSPGADSPSADSPGADSPGADSPGADSPGADSPGADSPGADSPGADPDGGVLVTDAVLDPVALAVLVRAPQCGAVVTFEGVVRDHNDGRQVTSVTYEAYAEMARSELAAIRTEVQARWPSVHVALAHRTGRLAVGEASVVVTCAAPHRREAFAACARAMDRIKETLPVWKSEERADGASTWL